MRLKNSQGVNENNKSLKESFKQNHDLLIQKIKQKKQEFDDLYR